MTSPLAPGGVVSLLFAVHTEAAACADGFAGTAGGSPLRPGAPPQDADARAVAACAPGGRDGAPSTLYTRDTLACALCLMGAKPRHSLKVAARVFDALTMLARRTLDGGTGPSGSRVLPHRLPRPVVRSVSFAGDAASLPRPHFEALVAWALAEYQYAKPDQLEDLRLACSIHERRTAVLVLLCGTSGTGKSTLAALLAARMGITTVVSTDTVRGVMRGMAAEETCPLLYASTYQAGDFVTYVGEPDVDPATLERKRTVKGYKAQSELVMAHLSRLLASCEARGESAIVEGVHLNLSLVMPLMARHKAVMPFLITISNESKHRERFAVRAKYMSLLPEANRYIKYFKQIRAIQDYLAVRAARFLVPRVNNTNVDRSVDTIHATAFGCMRRAAEGEALLAPEGDRALLLHDEYRRHTLERGAWSSKSMLAVIRSRHERDRAGGGAGAVSDAPSTSSSALTGVSSEEREDDGGGGRDRAAAARASASSDDDYPAAVVAVSDGGRTDSEAGFHSEVGSVLDSVFSEEDGGDDTDGGMAARFSRLSTLTEADAA